MKGIVYRSAALALACIVALSVLAFPSFATDYQSTYNFWNWAYDNSWFLGKAIIGFSAGNVCQVSEDGLHHATTHSGGGGSVDGQRIYNCVCDLCGQEFQAVATDLKQSYDTVINEQSYNAVNNTGYVALNVNWRLCDAILNSNTYIALEDFSSNYFKGTASQYLMHSFQWVCDYTPAVNCALRIETSHNIDWDFLDYVETSRYVDISSGSETLYSSYDKTTKVFNSLLECTLYANESYRINSYFSVDRTYGIDTGDVISGTFTFPKLFTASLGIDLQDTVSRPISFNPSFTYEDGDGKETVSDQQIIDEQGLIYYNPVTNTTTNITNWTYDYSDRSYTCTTENNTTTTIIYGDEYITINEGDVNNTYITYNIYYYTAPENSGDGSGSGSDGEGSGSSGSGDSSDDGNGIGGGLGELLGSLLGGLIDLITGLISGLIDSLINLVEMTIEKLGQVVNLFGEFGDALKVLWSWLPDEVVTILAAGVSVVVFASVIKLFV